MVFKDCKVQKIVSFLLRFQGGCSYNIVRSCGPLGYIVGLDIQQTSA